MWRIEEWGLLFVPGDASFCTRAGISVDSYGVKGGERRAAHTHTHTHTHIKRQIFWSLQLRLWQAWQLLVFQTLTPGQAAGSFSRSASDFFDKTTSRKGSPQPWRFKTRLNVGSLKAVIPGVVWLPFSDAPPGTGDWNLSFCWPVVLFNKPA